MGINWAGLGGFIIACGGAILIAVRAARRSRAVGGFFHAGTTRQHQISLGAYNVTLGAGLAYQMSVGQQYGWAGLLQVSSVLIGYALLAWFLRKFVPPEWVEKKNVFAAADEAIARATGAKSWFGVTLSLWMLVFFILVLAFEAYVAGNLLTALVAPAGGAYAPVAVSFALLAVAMTCAVAGGWQAVLDTDKIQFAAVSVVIVVLLGTALAGGEPSSAPAQRPPLGLQAWLTIGVLSLFGVATQFYSPVNWGIVSHLKRRQQVATFLVGGGLGTLLLAMITVCGVVVALNPGSTPLQTLLERLHASWDSPGPWGYLAGFVVVVGGVSMVLSTADSAILKLVMLAYDNILGRDSKTVTRDSGELKWIRACVVGAFLAAFLPLAILWIAKPQIIFVLVAMVTGLNVLAPLAVAVPVLNRVRGAHLLRRWVFLAISFLVCFSSGLALYFAFRGMNDRVTWISLSGLFVSIIFCGTLVVWAVARRHGLAKRREKG